MPDTLAAPGRTARLSALRRSAAAQSAVVLGIRVAGAVLQMLLVGAVALQFSVEAVGLNGVLWSVALVARMAGTVGVDIMGLRAASPLWSVGRVREARAVARRDLRAVRILWSCALAALVLVCAGLALADRPWVLLLALGVVAAASAFERLFVVQRQARGWPVLGQFLESVALPALGLLGVLLAGAFAPHLLVLSQVAAFVLIALTLWVVSPAGPLAPGARRRRGGRPRDRTGRVPGAVPGPRSREPEVEPVPWRAAVTVGAGGALTALCVRGPMFVLGGNSLATAGVYEVAQKIQSGGAMGTSAVATVFSSRTAVALRDRRTLVRLLTEAAASSLVLPVGLLAFLLAVGPDGLVNLLGTSYQGAWTAATVLVVATVVNAVTSAFTNVLVLGGRERLFTMIAAGQVVVVVGGALLSGARTAETMALWVLVGEAFRSLCMVGGLWLHLRELKTD
ncbi:hypothetical protein [Kocuria rhizophila]|uniref:hypothetical protein n=1 Tax=Kocuria rhizophila TaxID=72000 RepID=UPI000C8770C0|nr:hypothetical protein [Kocuria rhizophila]MCT1956603.1 hypothetical protein [Kocuria rhizophila]MCT2072553.1 hypothetical protein [Kocuria rhizophila]PMR90204.1 hypothetical protein C1H83_09165 [Kocuria rhizophila]